MPSKAAAMAVRTKPSMAPGDDVLWFSYACRVRSPEYHTVVHRAERCGVECSDAPTSPGEHGDAHDDHHRDRDSRAHQAGQPGEETEPVAAVERTVVVGEEQVDEPEGERGSERDLKRPQDVLLAGSEHDEQ